MTSEDDGYVHTPGDGSVKDGVEHGVPDSGGDRETDAGVEHGTPNPGIGSGTPGDDTGEEATEPDEQASAADAARDSAAGTDIDDSAVGATPDVGHPAATKREFDWRGWILVATLFVAFVVAPATIYLIPPGAEMYLTVLIVMPLFPALLLAAVAVWATTRP